VTQPEMTDETMSAPYRRGDLGAAAMLCILTVAWNAIAGTSAVAIGLASESLALIGFGLNAAVDSIASATLVWRFRAEGRDESRATVVEQSALRIVGFTSLLIATCIAIRSVVALATRSDPESSTGSLVVALGSVFVLAPLAYGKWRLARRLGSTALRGDSVLSGVGAALAAVALIGVAADNEPSWWWADAVGALLISAVLFLEGYRALRPKQT
jgi:divalent metal cation (Fe/Co/Zn/Cd) transporter